MELELKNSFVAVCCGKSLANAQRLIISSPELACNEFGLTEAGKLAVVNQAAGILKLVGPNAKILSSDFLRARQTAEILAQKAGTDVELHQALRERWFGDFDQADDSSYQQVWAEDQQDVTHTKWNVESVAAVAERMTGLVRQLNEKFENQVFLLVSHADPIQILSAWFKGQPLQAYRERERITPGQVQILHLL